MSRRRQRQPDPTPQVWVPLWSLAELGAGAALMLTLPLSAAYFLAGGTAGMVPPWTSMFGQFPNPLAEYDYFSHLYLFPLLLEVPGIVALWLTQRQAPRGRSLRPIVVLALGLALAVAGNLLDVWLAVPQTYTVGVAGAVLLAAGLTDYARNELRRTKRTESLLVPAMAALPGLLIVGFAINTHAPSGHLMWWHLAWAVVGFREMGSPKDAA